MKLRARWEGVLPELGQVLKTPGPKARCAYVIVGIRVMQIKSEYKGTPPSTFVSRLVLEVERITISELHQLPPSTAVHLWRWDRRDRKPAP